MYKSYSEQLEECTFQPNLNRKSSRKFNYVRSIQDLRFENSPKYKNRDINDLENSEFGSNSQNNFYEFNLKWKERKENNLSNQRKLKCKEEQIRCPFQPSVKPYVCKGFDNNSYSNSVYEAQGVQEHIERYK